jgi:hypothetical protein
MHTIIVCLWLYYILIVQDDCRSFDSRASTVGDDNTYNAAAAAADLYAKRFQTTDFSLTGGRYSFLVHSAYVPACF